MRDPTTWTILQKDGPNYLGLWYNVLPEYQMALITLGYVPFRHMKKHKSDQDLGMEWRVRLQAKQQREKGTDSLGGGGGGGGKRPKPAGQPPAAAATEGGVAGSVVLAAGPAAERKKKRHARNQELARKQKGGLPKPESRAAKAEQAALQQAARLAYQRMKQKRQAASGQPAPMQTHSSWPRTAMAGQR